MTEYKEIMIKQTSYCDLAQSKSKSPTLNKKKNKDPRLLCLAQEVWKSLYPPVKKNKKKPSKSLCPISMFLREDFHSFFSLLCFFLPVQLSLVKY